MQVTTPWGNATVVEEVKVAQRAGDKRFASLVQLLDGKQGERLVRFAYSTDGVVRRGPVTLREQDLRRLLSALGKYPQLAGLLELGR